MTDILIRAVPGAVIDEIDRQARALGISRTAFLRRRLDREFRRAGGVSTDDLVRLAELIRDHDEPETDEPGLIGPELIGPELIGPESDEPELVDGPPS